ncbi:MAG: hypothetical protein K1W05_03980 [Desulfovibrio sp.]|jgi:hypothetical protein
MVNKNNAKNYSAGMVLSPKNIWEASMPEELRSMIEREAMRIIDEKRKAQKITVDDIARRLYPEKGLPAARMMIQRLRSAQGNKPPRKMDLGEYVELAKAVGLDPASTLTVIMQQFDETKI